MARPNTAFTALVTTSLLGVAACGDDPKEGGGASTATEAERTTEPRKPRKKAPPGTVNLGDYWIEPQQLAVRRGTTLQVDLVDVDFHNLTVERGQDPKKDTPDLLATQTWEPGGRGLKLKFDLKPGTYAMTCTVPKHREWGMIGTVTVR